MGHSPRHRFPTTPTGPIENLDRTGRSRRAFLSRSGALGASVFLAGCAATSTSVERALTSDSSLTVVNWVEYIPPDAVNNFVAASSLFNVDYREEYVDNISGFSDIIEPELSGGGVPYFDLITPTQWVAGRMIDNGWVEALPLEAIPNHVNLDPRFMTSDFDRGSRFQMPWQGGMTGISYNPEATGGPISSVGQFLDPGNTNLRGNVGLVGEMREAVGLAMLANGDDPARPSAATANAGLDSLFDLADAGHFQSVVFDDFVQELTAGRLVASMAWSGQAAALQLDQPQFEFVIPDEGAISWFDTMVIPRNAQNYGGAAQWINWAYNPVNAAQISAWNLYVCPVLGTQDALRQLGGFEAELADNPLVFPDTETRNRLFNWGTLPLETELALEARFDQLTESIGFAS